MIGFWLAFGLCFASPLLMEAGASDAAYADEAGKEKKPKQERKEKAPKVADEDDLDAVPGEGEKGRPPGWSRGDKEGWEGGDLPPGQQKKIDSRPPGWSKGEKRGWEGKDLPPGQEKKSRD
jgi:hypothetical protein